jgi:uncharacterized protein
LQGTPADLGMDQWEAVEFPASDGVNLKGWFVSAEGDDAKPTIIFMHGLGGNRADLLSQAAAVVENGYNALLFDVRNHGESEGTITTLAYHEINDVRGAVDYLLARDDVDGEKIGLVGHSMGAIASLIATAEIPEIKAVVAEAGFKNIRGNTDSIIRALTGRAPVLSPDLVLMFVDQETGVPFSQISAIDKLGDITPRPVLFAHGDADTIIDVANSQEMYDAAGDPKELYIVEGAEHDPWRLDSDAFNERLVGFFNDHLIQPES